MRIFTQYIRQTPFQRNSGCRRFHPVIGWVGDRNVVNVCRLKCRRLPLRSAKPMFPKEVLESGSDMAIVQGARFVVLSISMRESRTSGRGWME